MYKAFQEKTRNFLITLSTYRDVQESIETEGVFTKTEINNKQNIVFLYNNPQMTQYQKSKVKNA